MNGNSSRRPLHTLEAVNPQVRQRLEQIFHPIEDKAVFTDQRISTQLYEFPPEVVSEREPAHSGAIID